MKKVSVRKTNLGTLDYVEAVRKAVPEDQLAFAFYYPRNLESSLRSNSKR